MRIESIVQPTLRTTSDALEGILELEDFNDLSVAVAYITSGGLSAFSDTLSKNFCMSDVTKKKRWVTSFDYCRTEPAALEALLQYPSLSVRIHNPEACLSNNKCWPNVPFHPKTFLFRNDEQIEFVLAGSGNLSRSGLSKGYEAGFVIGVNHSDVNINTSALESVCATRIWFEDVWETAKCLDTNMLARYKKLYESIENFKNPTPTDDDIVSSDTSNAALSVKELQRLRVCQTFWIDAGNITKNRGPRLPGNQLMMKRMSRVFFGFDSIDISKNNSIGDVNIKYNDGLKKSYSLTYSDNGMDKLVLPIPDAEGPNAYDNHILVFKTIGLRCYKLELYLKKELAKFRQKSLIVDGAFKMVGGREWGVF